MNNTMAFLLGGLLLLAWASLLFAFKLLCLDKIKYHFGRYSLGMIFAYGLLLLLYVASEHYPPLKALLLNWHIGRIPRRDHLDSRPPPFILFSLSEKAISKKEAKKASSSGN